MEENPHLSACAFLQLHLWQNTCQLITGGYADFAHFRLYRWTSGCRYVVNHNWPSSADGRLLTDRGLKLKLQVDAGSLARPLSFIMALRVENFDATKESLFGAWRGADAPIK